VCTDSCITSGVSLQGHFHRLMWPELVIATSSQQRMRGRHDLPLSKGRERNRIFPLNLSRMIKIALGVYDTPEITIEARSPAPSS
jgi:hypothetical protein